MGDPRGLRYTLCQSSKEPSNSLHLFFLTEEAFQERSVENIFQEKGKATRSLQNPKSVLQEQRNALDLFAHEEAFQERNVKNIFSEKKNPF
jgi:hypothetical protein